MARQLGGELELHGEGCMWLPPELQDIASNGRQEAKVKVDDGKASVGGQTRCHEAEAGDQGISSGGCAGPELESVLKTNALLNSLIPKDCCDKPALPPHSKVI